MLFVIVEETNIKEQSWHSTQEKFVKQPFYRCYDCFKDPLEGCCYQCVSACPAGHGAAISV